MDLKAVIFDLDGVLVTTDEYHYGAWKRMVMKKASRLIVRTMKD